MPENESSDAVVRALSRDQIRARPRVRSALVEIAEWGGSVRVRELSSTERDLFDTEMMELNEQPVAARIAYWKGFRVKIAILAAVDDELKPLFSEADREWLADTGSSALQLIFDSVWTQSRMTAKDVAKLTANLGDARAASSTTGSASR